MPTTFLCGRPVAFCSAQTMASSGLVMQITKASGAYFLMPAPTCSITLRLIESRSSRLMPGLGDVKQHALAELLQADEMSQGSADLAGANQSNLVARHGNLSFEPEPGGRLGELNLVIPFDRPVQVAPCSIAELAANSVRGRTPRRHCDERKRRSNPDRLLGPVDCFAEPVIGRAFARP